MCIGNVVFIGHVIECFGCTTYGFFSVLLAPVFFGSFSSGFLQLLAAYGAFAVNFVAAPIGAVFSGILGDRCGRRIPLLLEFIGTGVATLSIGLLPDYSTIGNVAPVLLMLCRFVQGFFLSAEYAGVNVYNYEKEVDKSNIGKSTSFLIFSGYIGAIMATIVGAVVTIDGMPTWMWRIPFVVGGISSIIIFLLRANLKETEEYVELESSDRDKCFYSPYKEIFSTYGGEFLCAMLLMAFESVSLYAATIYVGAIFHEAGYSISESMHFQLIALIIKSASTIFMGRLADKVTIKRMVIIGIFLFILFSFPSCALIFSELSLWKIYIYMFLILFISSITSCCGAAYVASLFPVSCRCSASFLSDSLGAVCGGFTPMIILVLTEIFHSRISILVWIYAVTIPCLIFVVKIYKKTDNENEKEVVSIC